MAAGDDAVGEAAAFLAQAERSAPAAGDVMLAHPFTRVWAQRCLDSRERGGAGAAETLGTANTANTPSTAGTVPRTAASARRASLTRLNAIAVAVAVHGGLDAGFPISPVDGALRLPTLGAAPARDRRPVPVSHADGLLTFGAGPAAIRVDLTRDAPDPDGGPWQPVRLLTAPGYLVRLDDVDPDRACAQWPVTDRLTAAEVRRWQEAFTGAAAYIEAELPAHRDGLRAGLTTLVPLTPGAEGRAASSIARDAFGALAAALPDTPEDLARRLVDGMHIAATAATPAAQATETAAPACPEAATSQAQQWVGRCSEPVVALS